MADKLDGLGIPPKQLNELADAFRAVSQILRKIATQGPAPGPSEGDANAEVLIASRAPGDPVAK